MNTMLNKITARIKAIGPVYLAIVVMLIVVLAILNRTYDFGYQLGRMLFKATH